jgi:DNA-binding MurR/RpiR family transcriptional regulator
VDVATRIKEAGPSLTAAERRVAEVVLRKPQSIAFGTVAELAAAAGSGAATVVRLATKLGFDGFTGLQSSVQDDLAKQLRPAAERIQEQRPDDPSTAHTAAEMANVEVTLGGADPDVVADVIDLLADPSRAILMMSSESATGVATQFASDLGALRSSVDRVAGSEVAVMRHLALAGESAVLVVIDVRRYDRWLLQAVSEARSAGLMVVALTDSVLSPLAALAHHTLVLSVASASPFESHVGTLALLNRFVVGVADRLRGPAADRLRLAEALWRRTGALTDG